MQLSLEFQRRLVEDEVSAITAVVRPILAGVLYALKKEVAKEAGGIATLKLFMLGRLRRPGDGDVGICFEYAVHDAILEGNELIVPRIADGLKLCGINGSEYSSILFGAEKSGALDLVNTAVETLTDESVLLYGSQGRPVKLKRHIKSVASAFRRKAVRDQLPASIAGLWKADLFSGCKDSDRWVGSTLKINRRKLEGAAGLRLGIVPSFQGKSDKVYKDDGKNLVICPLPYDGGFMQVFYQAWEVVVQFLAADCKVPKEVALPRPASRQVAQYLADRRDFPVLEVIDALLPLAQPELLETQQTAVELISSVSTSDTAQTTSAIIAPVPVTLGA